MTGHDADGDLAAALAERALARSVLGAAGAGLALGTVALLFLVVSGSRLDALTLPVVALAGVGQVTGLAAAAACVLRLRQVRAGGSPQLLAAAAQRTLRVLGQAALVVGVLAAAALVLLLEETGTALLGAVVGTGLLAQVVVVLTVLRRPLGRASRAPRA